MDIYCICLVFYQNTRRAVDATVGVYCYTKNDNFYVAFRTRPDKHLASERVS